MTNIDIAETAGGVSRIGVDIGGTFTDVATVDADGRLRIGKRLTTHGAEQDGVIGAVRDTGADLTNPATILAHGTTLVINALLERHGARVALVVTEGFADVLDIGRGNKPDGFALRYRRNAPLVPHEMRFEVAERVRADRGIERQPNEEELALLADRIRKSGAESIAVCFLNSYSEPANEHRVADYLRREFPALPVTVSADMSRQWREWERFTTATANAYVAPVAQRYLKALLRELSDSRFEGRFVVLDSRGGAMSLDTATRYPVRAVESGPVAGVIGARQVARDHEIADIVSFDMGGTTAKSALIEGGEFTGKELYWIGGDSRGFPLQVSTVDIVEVGVGGGSIAYIDETGRLQVGPRSAGSHPGPACYGLGGTEPTLTDANLFCGRIDKDNFVGSLELDLRAATSVIEGLAARAGMTPERAAVGIIKLANLQIAASIRRQTLERGNDPRGYTLLASGGAGPLHACEVAQEVGINRVLIPRYPGHYSAMGMLAANLRIDRREVFLSPLEGFSGEALSAAVQRISRDLTAELVEDDAGAAVGVEISYSLALRYRGQEHGLWISATQPNPTTGELAALLRRGFEERYEHRYGHLDALSEIEITELEVVAERRLPQVLAQPIETTVRHTRHIETIWDVDAPRCETPAIARSSLVAGERFTGPMVIFEQGSTIAIPPDTQIHVTADGLLSVDVKG